MLDKGICIGGFYLRGEAIAALPRAHRDAALYYEKEIDIEAEQHEITRENNEHGG